MSIDISKEPPEYPGASFFAPAAQTNYRRLTAKAPRSISTIVIHITNGRERIEGPISSFQKPGIQASGHYVVGRGGQVVQMVRHNDVAWHATTANESSIGIFHCARSPKELGHDDLGLPITREQYLASASLVRFLCRLYGLPIDRAIIKGHSEAAQTVHKDCPNKIWDWNHFMACISGATGSPAVHAVPEPQSDIAEPLPSRGYSELSSPVGASGVSVLAKDFSASGPNTKAEDPSYSNLTVTHGPTGFIEWRVNLPASGAWYLRAEMTAADARPCSLSINGVRQSERILAEVTGSWLSDRLRELTYGPYMCQAGGNVFRLDFATFMPHLKRIRFTRAT